MSCLVGIVCLHHVGSNIEQDRFLQTCQNFLKVFRVKNTHFLRIHVSFFVCGMCSFCHSKFKYAKKFKMHDIFLGSSSCISEMCIFSEDWFCQQIQFYCKFTHRIDILWYVCNMMSILPIKIFPTCPCKPQMFQMYVKKLLWSYHFLSTFGHANFLRMNACFKIKQTDQKHRKMIRGLHMQMIHYQCQKVLRGHVVQVNWGYFVIFRTFLGHP